MVEEIKIGYCESCGKPIPSNKAHYIVHGQDTYIKDELVYDDFSVCTVDCFLAHSYISEDILITAIRRVSDKEDTLIFKRG